MISLHRRAVLVSAAALTSLPDICAAQTPEPDEFIGPLPGWKNVRADFGAIGDGRADDTAALQRALDSLLATGGTATALYFPAGRYRITRTLTLPRKGGREARGLSIYGEDPASTAIIWDGAKGGTMFDYGAWYSAIGRLTFDGGRRAGIALAHGTEFVTGNDITDCVFADAEVGIEAGTMDHAGIAETAVWRCRFLNLSMAGASLRNFNSLDWWFWRCRFEDCGTGLTNLFGAGNFHAYACVFLRSRDADISIRNTGFLAFRDNISVGSKAFFVGHAVGAAAQLTFQRNQIFDTTDVAAIRVGNLGPISLLDNLIVSRPGQAGPAVEARSAIGVAIGNRFNAVHPMALKAGSTILDTTKVARTTPPPPPPARAARRFSGAITPIALGATAATIQGLIDAAARRGRPAALHFAPGSHSIDRTLVVPAGADLRLVGDGAPHVTRLEWTGQGTGPIVRLAAPSRGRLINLALAGASKADGLELVGTEAAGGQVLFDHTWAVGCLDAGYQFERLSRSQVILRNIDHGGNRVGMRLVGRGVAERQAPVVILSGSSSNNDISYELSAGARLLARDIWYETSSKPAFVRLTGLSDFCLNGSNIATPRQSDAPSVLVEGLKGRALFLGVIFTAIGPDALPAVVARGAEPASNLLLLGCHGSGEYFADHSRGGRAARLHSMQYTQGGGARPIADRGRVDEGFLRGMLEMARAPTPRDGAAVRFSRVYFDRCRIGARISG